MLQWWDPGARKNVADRVDSDLLAALVRARQIDERLRELKSGVIVRRRVDHDKLVESYLQDLGRRCEAGEVRPATIRRYAAALEHYRIFCQRTEVRRAHPLASNVDRSFRLMFTAFLENRAVAPNGRSSTSKQPMRGQAFVLDSVRAVFEWAADPDRGALLPEGFRNPFRKLGEARPVLRGDPLAPPDITLDMAVDLFRVCDGYQLRLFAPMLLFGLRAAEPCYLFREYVDGNWLRVPNNPDLAYQTKGRREKRFSLIPALAPFWTWWLRGIGEGVLYERRAILEGGEKASLRRASLSLLVGEFRRRYDVGKFLDASDREKLRDTLLLDAGGLTYDHVQKEFARLTRRLGWPQQATLKDLRHLFATTLNNGAMPEPYRRFLMGQAPGRAAIVAYTHLNHLERHFSDVVQREWTPIVNVLLQRIQQLDNPGI